MAKLNVQHHYSTLKCWNKFLPKFLSNYKNTKMYNIFVEIPKQFYLDSLLSFVT